MGKKVWRYHRIYQTAFAFDGKADGDVATSIAETAKSLLKAEIEIVGRPGEPMLVDVTFGVITMDDDQGRRANAAMQDPLFRLAEIALRAGWRITKPCRVIRETQKEIGERRPDLEGNDVVFLKDQGIST